MRSRELNESSSGDTCAMFINALKGEIMNKILKRFMSKQQVNVLENLMRTSEEKDFFKDMLEKLTTLVESMPVAYEQDGLGDKAVVHLHYFNGGSDWYITEKDNHEDTEQYQAFGFVVLNGNTQCAELGYISIEELLQNDIELDLYWDNCTLADVKAKHGV